MTTFDQRLLHWHAGERRGAAFFEAMATGTDDPSARDKWRLLADLERAMERRLAAALEVRRIEHPAGALPSDEATARAEGFAGMAWPEIMAALAPRLNEFVSTFRSQAAEAPEDGREIADDYVAHEQALLEFVEAEMAGGHGGTSKVEQLLKRWSE